MLDRVPPRPPHVPVDDQPIDPTLYVPDFREDDRTNRDLVDTLLEMEDYEDPTVIEDWLLPYRPKH